MGGYFLLPNEELQSDRIIDKIAVNFRAKASYDTMDVLRIYDISLEFEAPTSRMISWYHDCSNTTGFEYSENWDMDWWSSENHSWDIQEGSISSDGSSIIISDIPSGSGWHGPVFEYKLLQTFEVQDLINFSILQNADNSLNSYTGYHMVLMGDADRNVVMYSSFHDGWIDYSRGSYGVQYVFENGSRVGFGSGYPVAWTSFNGRMSLCVNQSAALLGYVEGIGSGLVTTLSSDEMSRKITYLAIAFAKSVSYTLIPITVDEISIEYSSIAEDITTASTSEITSTTNTTSTISQGVTNSTPTTLTSAGNVTSESTSSTGAWWSQAGTWTIISVIVTIGSGAVIVVFIVLIIRNKQP